MQLEQRVCDIGAGAFTILEAMLVPHRGEEVVVPLGQNAFQYSFLHVLGDMGSDCYRSNLVEAGFRRSFIFGEGYELGLA